MDQLLTSTISPPPGERMHRLIAELYPICRSITGDGFRQTLRRLREQIPLEIHEVPTGTQVFDWTVPKEWNVRDAWVKNAAGEKVIDFRRSNLHLVNYSVPVRRKMPLAELREHLHTLPDQPDWIPYRTSYYKESWGFCLAANELAQLQDGEYEVCIDSTLEDGSLTYGEYFTPGQAHRRGAAVVPCVPSVVVQRQSLGRGASRLLSPNCSKAPRSNTRIASFSFPARLARSPGWHAMRSQASRIRHGLVVACVGDSGKFHYKRSRRGNAEIDRAVIHALKHSGEEFEVREFSPYGYDERQFCSPGFNLAVGSLTRTPHGEFPEYHTSADNLDLVRPQALAGSLALYLSVLRILENNARFQNQNPHCEPQLGKRGLYRTLGGLPDATQLEMAMLWVLNLSDGDHSLLDIAERAELPFDVIHQATKV